MIKVSVLIPAYNVAPYIRECIDSVLNQTLKEVEVICVDDASTDETLSILKEYEKKDNRVRVLCHEVNKGQSCGRNLALKYAAGEYVYMLDADDFIECDALEKLYDICKKDSLDLVGFETVQFFEDENLGNTMPAKMISYSETEVMDGRSALCYTMETESFSLSTPTYYMRRGYLTDNGISFVEGILHEDVGYLFELMVRAERVRFLPEKFFHRRVRKKSTMTGGFTAKNIEGYIKSYLKSFELEDFLRPYTDSDEGFREAVNKWRRDIFGRIRQLYYSSEETIYYETGENVPEGPDTEKNGRSKETEVSSTEEVRRLFETIKLIEPGKAMGSEVFGENLNEYLRNGDSGNTENDNSETGALHFEKGIYICGEGQYAARASELLGAYDIVVRGVLALHKEHASFRGFPVYDIFEDDVDTEIPVLISVSHYTSVNYEKALIERGFVNLYNMR